MTNLLLLSQPILLRFVVLLFWLLPVLGLSQVQISGKLQTSEGEGLEDATITVYQAGKWFHELVSLKRGKYSFKVPIGHRYLIVIKKDYYATTRISYSTVVPKHLERKPDGGMFSFKASMDVPLLECRAGMDPTPFKKPIKEIYFDKSSKTFIEDQKYTAMVQPALKAYYAEMKKKKLSKAPLVMEKELLDNLESASEKKPSAEKSVGETEKDAGKSSVGLTETKSSSTLSLDPNQQQKVDAADREAQSKKNQQAKAALQGELLEMAATEKKQQQTSVRKKEGPKPDETLELKTAQSQEAKAEAQREATIEQNQAIQSEHIGDLVALAAEERRRKLRAQQAAKESPNQNLAERPEIVNYESQEGNGYVWTTEVVFANRTEVYQKVKQANGAYQYFQDGREITETVYTKQLNAYR